MLPDQQDRIMAYFIEEAKDHLNTIEQGLLNLQSTLADSELLNEVFRAAHSVKGGAAMLGLNSIMQVAHRLEDSFKILQEHPLQIDQQLESLFLRVYDTLQALLEQLSGPFGLTEEVADGMLRDIGPVFTELQNHIEALLKGEAKSQKSKATKTQKSTAKTQKDSQKQKVAATSTASQSLARQKSALEVAFTKDVAAKLREMLQLFKGGDHGKSRERLTALCTELKTIGHQFNLLHFGELIAGVQNAIAESANSYQILAPIAIKEVKQAQELVLANREAEITVSESLRKLLRKSAEGQKAKAKNQKAKAKAAEASSSTQAMARAARPLSVTEGAKPGAADVSNMTNALDDWFSNLEGGDNGHDAQKNPLAALFEENEGIDTLEEGRLTGAASMGSEPGGPEVGIAELNSLADLFEGEALDLDAAWEEVASPQEAQEVAAAYAAANGDDSGDFSDLLFDEDDAADLLQKSSKSVPVDDPDLFGSDSAALADLLEDGLLMEMEEISLDADVLLDDAATLTPADELADLFGLVDEAVSDSAAPATVPKATPGKTAKTKAKKETKAKPAKTAKSASSLDDDLGDLLNMADTPALSAENGLDQVAVSSDEEMGALFAEIDHSILEMDAPQEEEVDLEGMLAELPAEAAATSDTAEWDALFEGVMTSEAGIESEEEADTGFFEELFAGDNADLSALETEMASPSEAAGDFADDLDSLLEGVGESEAALDIAAMAEVAAPEAGAEDNFDDLEAMLGEETPAASAEIASVPLGEDVFSDLENLLGDVAEKPQPEPVKSKAAIVGGVLAKPQAASEDEFSDLEDLLKETQQAGGRSTGVGQSMAGGRRPGRVTELSMRVPVKQLDNLSNLMGELVVNRNSLEQDQERMRQFLDNLLHQVSLLSDVGQRMQDLYERSLLEIALLASRQSSMWRGGAEPVSSRNHDERGLSDLEMDRFTPFHSLSQEIIELIVRVRESASDIEFLVDEADQVTRQLRQITMQLQEGLTRARMLPFAQIADKLRRGVRDVSINCGKQAQLVVEGRETLIDKMILEQLDAPMTHLVNNSITHGIETPDVREAAGKPPVGTITIRVFHQGNQTVISVSDDGAGINVERVKAKAIEKGLMTPEQARAMTKLDVYDLLFHPGFSTKDQADDYSGRGVGMDVVRTNLNEVRGAITTDSTLGKGTVFTIRLPLILSISKALCCISDRNRIAFPMDGVEDMIDVPKEEVRTGSDGQSYIEWRGSKLAFRPLRDLLCYNRQMGRGSVYGTNPEEDVISVIVLRSAGNYLAVQVDQVLNEQEIVIKQLEGPVPKPVGMAGATVLGDGQIVAIADVLELIDLAAGRLRREASGSLWDEGKVLAEAVPEKTEPTVLIVDDSITVRELLSMTFNKAGYRVEQARDGKEAWEKLKSGLPCDIVFCDIEMPRMDGLELLSRMQKDAQLTTLPIAMLTSRGADRHRQMAYSLGARGYFTKPYLEEHLLDAASRMLKGEIVGAPAAPVATP